MITCSRDQLPEGIWIEVTPGRWRQATNGEILRALFHPVHTNALVKRVVIDSQHLDVRYT